MATGGPETSGSGPSGRGLDLAVWALVIAALIGLAGAVAWYLSNATFTIREVTWEDDAVDVELIPVAPAPRSIPAEPSPSAGPPTARDLDAEGVAPTMWARQPAPLFPARAARQGIEAGQVSLLCQAFASGEIGDCEVLDESPADGGFAGAALASMRQARVTPRHVDGNPVASRIRFTIHFRIAPEP